MSSLIRLSPHQQTTYRELWYYAIEHQFTNALIDWLQEQFACVDFGRLRESYCERIPPRIFYNLEHCHIRCDAYPSRLAQRLNGSITCTMLSFRTSLN